MAKNPDRKEFEKLKRRKGFYSIFGGKDSSRDLHHKILLSMGGNNDVSNLVYINRGLHRLYHRLLNANEAECVKFSGKKPSDKKVVDEISKGCLDRYLLEKAIEDVRNDLRCR